MNWIDLVLIVVIVSYIGYVVYKRIKSKKVCSCGCANCPTASSCNQKK